MVYQGSKNRIAKYLLPIIHGYIEDFGLDTYIELFVGGANLIDKVQCEHKIGCDINSGLIKLLRYVQNDHDIKIAPEDCSFEHFADVRASRGTNKYTEEYTALIGYCASYSARGFPAGYGRDSKGGRCIYSEHLKNLKRQAPLLDGIEFRCCDYKDFDTTKYKNALYYFDPPYRGTKPYGNYKFDYEQFYEYCRQLSKDNIVLISEYWMPDDFKCIWEKERKVLLKSNRITGDIATERLFTVLC